MYVSLLRYFGALVRFHDSSRSSSASGIREREHFVRVSVCLSLVGGGVRAILASRSIDRPT
jgi:hypothetical protein